ncbi:MAG: YkgJ family cysteine cluster protein [Planctomycetota bacterium]
MKNWYADGLSFACTQCGNCCTGTPGYVWLSPKEQKEIAAALDLPVEEFLRTKTRLVHGMVSLIEMPNGDCALLTEDRRCSIQSVKPRQCLAFPFWPRLLASKQEWERAAMRCPGIGTGPRYRPQEIDAIAERGTPREVVERIFLRRGQEGAEGAES